MSEIQPGPAPGDDNDGVSEVLQRHNRVSARSGNHTSARAAHSASLTGGPPGRIPAATAGAKPLSPNSRRRAGAQIILATRFLAWLAEQDLPLGQCRQIHLDAWAAEHSPEVRNNLRVFLKWGSDNRLTCCPLDLPDQRGPAAPPLPEQQRLALLGQVLTEDTAPLRTRVAASLVLLYAQPVSRIVRLTTDDVINDAGQVLIRLGHPPLPVPEPVAAMLFGLHRDAHQHAHRHQPAINLAVPWPPSRPAPPPRVPRPTDQQNGHPHHRQPGSRHTPAHPRQPGTRRRRRPQLPPRR